MAPAWPTGRVSLDFQRPTNAPLPPTTPLMGGLVIDFKLECAKTTDPATVKLGWALPYQKPEIIGLTNFFYYFTGAKSPESIALARLTNAGPVVRGVVLRNGTFLAASIARADESAVRLAFAGRPEAPVLSLTPHLATARRLALVWGVHSVHIDDVADVRQMTAIATAVARRERFADTGQTIVAIAGMPFGEAGTTNLLRIATV